MRVIDSAVRKTHSLIFSSFPPAARSPPWEEDIDTREGDTSPGERRGELRALRQDPGRSRYRGMLAARGPFGRPERHGRSGPDALQAASRKQEPFGIRPSPGERDPGPPGLRCGWAACAFRGPPAPLGRPKGVRSPSASATSICARPSYSPSIPAVGHRSIRFPVAVAQIPHAVMILYYALIVPLNDRPDIVR